MRQATNTTPRRTTTPIAVRVAQSDVSRFATSRLAAREASRAADARAAQEVREEEELRAREVQFQRRVVKAKYAFHRCPIALRPEEVTNPAPSPPVSPRVVVAGDDDGFPLFRSPGTSGSMDTPPPFDGTRNGVGNGEGSRCHVDPNDIDPNAAVAESAVESPAVDRATTPAPHAEPYTVEPSERTAEAARGDNDDETCKCESTAEHVVAPAALPHTSETDSDSGDTAETADTAVTSAPMTPLDPEAIRRIVGRAMEDGASGRTSPIVAAEDLHRREHFQRDDHVVRRVTDVAVRRAVAKAERDRARTPVREKVQVLSSRRVGRCVSPVTGRVVGATSHPHSDPPGTAGFISGTPRTSASISAVKKPTTGDHLTKDVPFVALPGLADEARLRNSGFMLKPRVAPQPGFRVIDHLFRSVAPASTPRQFMTQDEVRLRHQVGSGRQNLAEAVERCFDMIITRWADSDRAALSSDALAAVSASPVRGSPHASSHFVGVSRFAMASSPAASPSRLFSSLQRARSPRAGSPAVSTPRAASPRVGVAQRGSPASPTRRLYEPRGTPGRRAASPRPSESTASAPNITVAEAVAAAENLALLQASPQRDRSVPPSSLSELRLSTMPCKQGETDGQSASPLAEKTRSAGDKGPHDSSSVEAAEMDNETMARVLHHSWLPLPRLNTVQSSVPRARQLPTTPVRRAGSTACSAPRHDAAAPTSASRATPVRRTTPKRATTPAPNGAHPQGAKTTKPKPKDESSTRKSTAPKAEEPPKRRGFMPVLDLPPAPKLPDTSSDEDDPIEFKDVDDDRDTIIVEVSSCGTTPARNRDRHVAQAETPELRHSDVVLCSEPRCDSVQVEVEVEAVPAPASTTCEEPPQENAALGSPGGDETLETLDAPADSDFHSTPCDVEPQPCNPSLLVAPAGNEAPGEPVASETVVKAATGADEEAVSVGEINRMETVSTAEGTEETADVVGGQPTEVENQDGSPAPEPSSQTYDQRFQQLGCSAKAAALYGNVARRRTRLPCLSKDDRRDYDKFRRQLGLAVLTRLLCDAPPSEAAAEFKVIGIPTHQQRELLAALIDEGVVQSF